MTTMTLAKMKMLEAGDPELREARYRRLRATTVLAAASATVKEMQDQKLNKALAKMREQNFDMERLSSKVVEYVYGVFDEELTNKITAEFRFVPRWTNVQNHGECIAFCDLCGKGDSLEHRENRDKLRYTFRLQNDVGGTDVWVGSSCILHHGLHVDGARTAEEAERLLNKAFNQAKLQWEIEQWRADNPDHFEIPEQWEKFRYIRIYTYHENLWSALGLDRRAALKKWYQLMGKARDGSRNHFAGAFKQYTKRGALTPGKHEAWIDAQRFTRVIHTIYPVFLSACNKTGAGAYHVPQSAIDLVRAEATALKRRKPFQDALRVLGIEPPKAKRQPRRVKKS